MSSQGRLFLRGEVWWLDYGFRGHRTRESSRSTRKRDAQRLLNSRLGEMSKGRLVGPREERLKYKDLSDMIATDYEVNGRKSAKRLKSSLKHLTKAFNHHRALDITTDRISAYTSTRLSEGAKPATVQKELAALKRMFTLAKRAALLSTVPYVPSIEVNNTRTNFVDRGELEAIVAELPDDLSSLIRFLYLTGWRKAEALGLTWNLVEFENGVVRLAPGTTKNSEGRTFPFDALPELRALLEEQRDRTTARERATSHMIPSVFHRNGKPITDFRGAWTGACTRAGLASIVVHDLRRSAVRNLERAGVPRSTAMKLTGHKTESVYRRYAIVDENDLRSGVEKLAIVHASPQRQVLPLRQGTAG